MTLETDDDLEGGGLGNQTSPLVASQLEMSADVSGKAKGPPRSAMTRKFLSQHSSPNNLVKIALALLTVTLLVAPFLAIQWCILLLVFTSCAFGGIASMWLSRVVLQCDDGTAEMRAVSDPIREGASGFLSVQYSAITKFAFPLAILIVVSYQFRPIGSEPSGVAILGNTALGFIAALGFVSGAICSAVAGFVSMWVAAQSNIRVASAARRSYGEALVVCFRGGAFSAVLNLTLCISGVAGFFTLLILVFANGSSASLKVADVPMLLVGYGFGASFVALFMQLGGGIYTKAADVGADLVGKVEQSIPEDDPRNPAVIADLVGDMVGDCVGSSADVFESVAAEIIGAMILGSTLSTESGMTANAATKFLFFPLVVHAMDIIVSSVGIAFVGVTRDSADSNPMRQLQKGYLIAIALSILGFYIITSWLLEDPNNPGSAFKFFLCGIVGMVCAYVIVLSTQYYTDYEYSPVKSIAEASTTGHGTNIIVGISVGMKATLIPTLTVAVAVLTAYHLGASTGIGDGRNAGLFGTAVATMGMLSSAVYVLSMNNYGPIADNAGGIAEMSMQPEHVRDVCDRLDAAGNVTKAITKGYSIGSASMACFLLFGAFMDEFSEFSGLPFKVVDIAIPEVLIGGLIGSMIIFYFTGLAISAVGRTAHEVVLEVRRQFAENPDIMIFKAKPDYERCVALVTNAALKEMMFPGAVCVVTPVLVGLVFRFVGEATKRPLLGAEVLASYLMFGTVTGVLMALFLDTTGGAWDNAKKYIELGNFGGKNSEAHKAAVTGDTVGDPFKDTAGPSLHVVIKLLSTTILVAGPLFIARMPPP
ncbi:hydrogen-translocating pyrophosphatase [Fragilaria crotonensis]|nr:hydrogen-translocating pyrophosphatase [Fragilaria crotonensis]